MKKIQVQHTVRLEELIKYPDLQEHIKKQMHSIFAEEMYKNKMLLVTETRGKEINPSKPHWVDPREVVFDMEGYIMTVVEFNQIMQLLYSIYKSSVPGAFQEEIIKQIPLNFFQNPYDAFHYHKKVLLVSF